MCTQPIKRENEVGILIQWILNERNLGSLFWFRSLEIKKQSCALQYSKTHFQKQNYVQPGHLQMIPRKCSSNKMFIALIPSECVCPVYTALWFVEVGRSLHVNSVIPKQEKTNLPVANETETGHNHHSELQRAATLKAALDVSSAQEDAEHFCSSLRLWRRQGYNLLQHWVYPTSFNFFPLKGSIVLAWQHLILPIPRDLDARGVLWRADTAMWHSRKSHKTNDDSE